MTLLHQPTPGTPVGSPQATHGTADLDPPRLGHRPAVDGLRALAVVAVLLYHADLPWFPGGFLGVDVFFVISGFLITTLLVEERERSGTIALGRFWVRRLRRLLPALLAVLAVVLVYGWIVARPEQRSMLRGDVIATLAYVANWRFVASGQSYFASFLEPSPLRHAWSLAVEEQWYVVWPVVVAVALRTVRGRAQTLLWPAVAAALASAALMALLWDREEPSRVYYGTDTRAQGLLVGSALAFWYVHHRRTRPRHASRASRRVDACAWVALVAVLVAVLTVGDRAPALYLGGFLVVSAAAAVLVYAAADDRPTTFQGVFAHPALRWLGERSYGLYLWHWPVFVWLNGTRTGLDGVPLFLVQVAVSLACTEVSFRLVERPVRGGALPGVRFARVAVIGSVAVVLAAVPLRTPAGSVLADVDSLTAASLPPVSRPAPALGSVTASSPDTPGAPGTDGSPATTAPAAAVPPSPAPTAPPPPVRLLVLGDSTAVTFALGFPAEYTERGLVYQTTQATVGCGITPGRPHSDEGLIPGGTGRCGKWEEDWTTAVATAQPDVALVMVGAWEVLDHLVDGTVYRFGTPEWADLVRSSLDRAVTIAGSGGARVALMNVPCMNESAEAQFPTQARNDPERVAAVNLLMAGVAAAHPGTAVLDYASFICPGGRFQAERDGVVTRPDGVHLGDEGAALTWSWVVPHLQTLAQTPR